FDKKLELLRISSFLGTAPPEMLSEIASVAHEQSFGKGQFIYAKNDPAREFYLLVEGRIGHPEVQRGDKDRFAYRADTPGQLFGFAAAVQGQPLRVISARCELPTTVLAVDGQWFQELCRRYGKEGEERLRELVRAHAGYERTILGRPGWLSVRNARRKYESESYPTIALDDCSVEVRSSEFSAVLGPRGSGKSTLARVIAGLETLDDGVIYLDGDVINRRGGKPKPRRIRLHQQNSLRPAKTLLHNLQRATGGGDGASAGHVRKLINQFGLSEFADCRTRALPPSICCCAEIIATFLCDADVIVLDAPFASGLERTQLHRLLLELHRYARKTVLLMTEDVEESVRLADRVQMMANGRIQQSILIDLPLLRRPELFLTPEFVRLRQKVFEALYAPVKTMPREMPEPPPRRAPDDKVAVEFLPP
ncbi:MAG: ATP-binding cassette domain-containing protein, partial [Burkholderiales bacterium]